MSLADFRRQQAVNVEGVFLGIKHCLPLMRKAGNGGSIVNMSSVAGLKGSPVLAAYCATKGAVRLLTKAIAMECANFKDGVRVNSVHPGIIETPIWESIAGLADAGSNAPPDLDALSATAVPLGVKGLPLDIANGVLWLASRSFALCHRRRAGDRSAACRSAEGAGSNRESNEGIYAGEARRHGSPGGSHHRRYRRHEPSNIRGFVAGYNHGTDAGDHRATCSWRENALGWRGPRDHHLDRPPNCSGSPKCGLTGAPLHKLLKFYDDPSSAPGRQRPRPDHHLPKGQPS